MREILFRAKRIDDGDWVEGFLFDSNMINESRYFHEIDSKTICQYTGLKDRNGNRIWENDIVKIEYSMDEGIGNIEFYDGMWYVDGEPSNSLYDIIEYDYHAEVEIIGNVFDNPELLKN